MERKYEHRTRSRTGWMWVAFEGALSNLPILVCGFAVALALVNDVFGS